MGNCFSLKIVGQLSFLFVLHIVLSASRSPFVDMFMNISMAFYVTGKATMKWEEICILHSELFCLNVLTCASW